MESVVWRILLAHNQSRCIVCQLWVVRLLTARAWEVRVGVVCYRGVWCNSSPYVCTCVCSLSLSFSPWAVSPLLNIGVDINSILKACCVYAGVYIRLLLTTVPSNRLVTCYFRGLFSSVCRGVRRWQTADRQGRVGWIPTIPLPHSNPQCLTQTLCSLHTTTFP